MRHTVRMRLLPGDARQAVFSPLDDRAGRTEVVVRRLGNAIALGLLADGERLPPEADLATTLGVATVTLRDALADLRERGLVETRRGRGGGSFVRVHRDALADLSRTRLQEVSSTDLRELGDLHAGLAGTAALLAAARATGSELTRLADLCDRLAAARTTTEQRRLDGRWWIELAAAAQSVRLTRFEIDLQVELGLLAWASHEPDAVLSRRVRSHRRVVAALAERNGAAARAEAEAQIQRDTAELLRSHLNARRGLS